jgi:hypothetical protein
MAYKEPIYSINYSVTKSCHIIIQVDGHVLILIYFQTNFRTFKFTFSKLILGFFCIGVLMQMLQRDTTSIDKLLLGITATRQSSLLGSPTNYK